MIGLKTRENGGTDLDLRERGSFQVSLSPPVMGATNSGAFDVPEQCSRKETAKQLASSSPPEGAAGADPAHGGHCNLSGDILSSASALRSSARKSLLDLTRASLGL